MKHPRFKITHPKKDKRHNVSKRSLVIYSISVFYMNQQNEAEIIANYHLVSSQEKKKHQTYVIYIYIYKIREKKWWVVTSSAETEISLAFSSASWRMKLTICWICFDTSLSSIFPLILYTTPGLLRLLLKWLRLN